MWNNGRSRNEELSPMMDTGFPSPSGFSPGPTSPPPFYAPNGPGPLSSARGSRSGRIPGPSMTPFPKSTPEQRPNEHGRHHRHGSRDHQSFDNRDIPQPFPHFVNEGPPKPGIVNPGFMNPDLMDSRNQPSMHGHERRRTHSQGPSGGHSPGFNSSQRNPGPGFPAPVFGDRSPLQDNVRHQRSRSNIQAQSRGPSPGFNYSQGAPSSGFPSPMFADRSLTEENIRQQGSRMNNEGRGRGPNPDNVNPRTAFPSTGFGDHSPIQANSYHGRNSTNSQGQGRGPNRGFNVNQRSPTPDFPSPGFGDHGPMQANIRHVRSRTNGQGLGRDPVAGFNTNHKVPTSAFPDPDFGDHSPIQANIRQERNRTNSQGQGRGPNPGFNRVPPGFSNPGFGDIGPMEEGVSRGRVRAYSQSRNPGFNGNPDLRNPGYPNPDLRDPDSERRNNGRHGRSRSYSQAPGFRGNQGIPNTGFPNDGFGESDFMDSGSYPSQENIRQQRGGTYSQGQFPGHFQESSRRPRRSQSQDRRPPIFAAPVRPIMTTAYHVKPPSTPSPTRQQRRPGPQPMMPPSEPSHVRAHTTPDGKRVHEQVFQYSKCTGRKKALCIGINYRGSENELRGCVNDAKNVRKFLINQWQYNPGDVVILTDDTHEKRRIPTRKNMIDAMRWLVHGAKAHDALFFHYSGHGGQINDLDGDEIDGLDEVIFPVDHARAGHIVDDELHSILVKSLPRGCRLTAVFDSCHSGTALDLPYVYHSNGRLKGNQVTPSARVAKSTSADVISWTACRDDQTSADATEAGEAVGAMSYAFRYSLKENPNQSYAQLLRSVREILRQKYSQMSQLSSSHPIDTDLRFVM